ncbi:MAG: hypothetical protein WBE13_21470 [Candidatus Acidiferrum sp.]
MRAKSDESNTNNAISKSNRTANIVAASSREALGPRHDSGAEARTGEEREARASRSEGGSSAAGAGAVQAVQAGLGGDCGKNSERARHAVCVPVLPEVASRSGAGTGIQEDAARAVGPLTPSGGIGNRWHAH